MRASARRPIRSTSNAIETASMESRLTTQSRGTGSNPPSSSTSLGSLRTVVVHGATIARFRPRMASSRDITTTGRRPISGCSHHQTSPRSGAVTRFAPRLRNSPGRPTHPVRRSGVRHTPSDIADQSPHDDVGPGERQTLGPAELSRPRPDRVREPQPRDHRQRSY